jgi:hypothetical protein
MSPINDWLENNCIVNSPFSEARRETLYQSYDAKSIITSMRRLVKTASVKTDLHFYIDADSSDKTEKTASKIAGRDFLEETISFPSKRKNESNYSCSVIFQKPENEVFAVSAYMVETYLGRYVHKSNFYFRKENRAAAERCFSRVLSVVKDLRQDMIEGAKRQVEVPHLLKRALSGEIGEIEPKSNHVATFLDPKNASEQSGPVIPFIPTERSIKDDLEMEA